MSQITEGKITFINHEKEYAMIEYLEGNKKKAVRADIGEKLQKDLKEKNFIRKTHHFMVGDVINFQVKLSPRGDRMIAANPAFLYNTALDVLIDKSRLTNKFTGYLKIADDKYFVKEIESYLFFPVPFSPWQLPPEEEELNEQVIFSLENTDKKEKIYASLFDNKYIPEFKQAMKLHKAKTPSEAEVIRITPHSIYLNVISDKIQAKLPFDESLKIGDKINVVISHMSKTKIAVARAEQ